MLKDELSSPNLNYPTCPVTQETGRGLIFNRQWNISMPLVYPRLKYPESYVHDAEKVF